jgi:hypothetical protein
MTVTTFLLESPGDGLLRYVSNRDKQDINYSGVNLELFPLDKDVNA